MTYKKKIVGGVVAASMLVALVPAATALAADDSAAAPAGWLSCLFGCKATFHVSDVPGFSGESNTVSPGNRTEWVAPDAPTIENKVFVGWFDKNGTQYVPGQTPLNSDVDLYAKYADQYTFHFVNDDNSTIKDVTLENTESGLSFYDFSKDVTAPAVEGKKFVGWRDSAGNRFNATDTFVGAGAAWAYPDYEDVEAPAVKYTFHFVNDDNSTIKDVTLENTESGLSFYDFSKDVTAPAVEGKKFVGWKNAAGNRFNATDTFTGPGEAWAYPDYEDVETPAAKYTVTFRLDADDDEGKSDIKAEGAADASFADIWAEANAAAEKAAAEGTKFVGWYYYGSDSLIAATDPIADGVTVYAKYVDETPAPNAHAVTFYMGADDAKGTEVTAKGAFKNFSSEVTAPKIEGKVFVGWAATGSDDVIAADTEVTGNWYVHPIYADETPAPNAHVVTFYMDADDEHGTQVLGTGAFDTFSSAVTAPKIEGKVFVGWVLTGSDEVLDGKTEVTGDWYVSPKYEDAPAETVWHEVSFYDGNDELIATVTYDDGRAFGEWAQQAPAVDGKVFVGWKYATGEIVDPTMPVKGDIHVYAAYEDAPAEDDDTQNVVSFYDADQNLIQTVGYYAKDKVKFSQYALGVQAPAVEGKVFAGWAFASNDGDVAVDVESVVTGNWAVYATYKDAPAEDDDTQNVVSFYDADQNLIQTVGYYAKDKVKFSQYALGVQAPAVEGKVFTGWGFASNDGDVPVDVDAVVTGDWAVYAMYEDATQPDEPKDDDTKDDETKDDTSKKDETKADKKKSKKKLSATGAAVTSVAVVAVIAMIGGGLVLTLRKRA